jgi:hypothetical protein
MGFLGVLAAQDQLAQILVLSAFKPLAAAVVVDRRQRVLMAVAAVVVAQTLVLLERQHRQARRVRQVMAATAVAAAVAQAAVVVVLAGLALPEVPQRGATGEPREPTRLLAQVSRTPLAVAVVPTTVQRLEWAALTPGMVEIKVMSAGVMLWQTVVVAAVAADQVQRLIPQRRVVTEARASSLFVPQTPFPKPRQLAHPRSLPRVGIASMCSMTPALLNGREVTRGLFCRN